MQTKHQVNNIIELGVLAQKLALEWRALTGQKSDAVAVCLTGELGAGKTAFVKALARALGIKSEPVSPTFVIHQAYDFPASGQHPTGTLHHLDVYRLKNPVKDLPPLGFGDMLNERNAIVCIEWGERVAELLPPGYLEISFEAGANNKRIVRVNSK